MDWRTILENTIAVVLGVLILTFAGIWAKTLHRGSATGPASSSARPTT